VEVQSLRKPTVPVWAINQIAREHGKDVKTLVEASDELRAVQQRALGGGESDQLRAATSAEREALRTLTEHVQPLLGREAPAATLERVSSTLRAAALDPETRELLVNGRLSDELQSAGFAPSNALESGLYRTLPPGAYTVIVQGVGSTTGIAVIGVYKVN